MTHEIYKNRLKVANEKKVVCDADLNNLKETNKENITESKKNYATALKRFTARCKEADKKVKAIEAILKSLKNPQIEADKLIESVIEDPKVLEVKVEE